MSLSAGGASSPNIVVAYPAGSPAELFIASPAPSPSPSNGSAAASAAGNSSGVRSANGASPFCYWTQRTPSPFALGSGSSSTTAAGTGAATAAVALNTLLKPKAKGSAAFPLLSGKQADAKKYPDSPSKIGLATLAISPPADALTPRASPPPLPSPRAAASPRQLIATPRGRSGRVTPINFDLFVAQAKITKQLKDAQSLAEGLKIWECNQGSFSAAHFMQLCAMISPDIAKTNREQLKPLVLPIVQLIEKNLFDFQEVDRLLAFFKAGELLPFFEAAVLRSEGVIRLGPEICRRVADLKSCSQEFNYKLLCEVGSSGRSSPLIIAQTAWVVLESAKTYGKAAAAASAASPEPAQSPRATVKLRRVIALAPNPDQVPTNVKALSRVLKNFDTVAAGKGLRTLNVKELAQFVDAKFLLEIGSNGVVLTTDEELAAIEEEFFLGDAEKRRGFDTYDFPSLYLIIQHLARMNYLNKSPRLFAKLQELIEPHLENIEFHELVMIGWALSLSRTQDKAILSKIVGELSEQYRALGKDGFMKLPKFANQQRQINQIWLHHQFGLELPPTDWGREVVEMLTEWRAIPEAPAAISRFQQQMHAVLRDVCAPYAVVPQMEKRLAGVDVDFFVELPVPKSAKMVASNAELEIVHAVHALGTEVISLISSYRQEASSAFVFEADGCHHFRGKEPDGATQFRNYIVPKIIRGKITGISDREWNLIINGKNGGEEVRKYVRDHMGLPDPAAAKIVTVAAKK